MNTEDYESLYLYLLAAASARSEGYHDPVKMDPENTSEADTYEPWFLIRNQEMKWGE
jgi:hypothetical protein